MKKYSILFLLVLNLIDGILTYIGLNLELYIEKNPLLDHLYSVNPDLFILMKILMPTIILIILMFLTYQKKLSKVTNGVIAIGNFIYLTIFMYHIYLIRIVIMT